jgi:tRNA modification GTPase
VSEIAGTTRDTIEELLTIEGIQFRLIDTAGIRAHTEDQIEYLGIEKSREKISQADIVLQILDATDAQVEEELPVDGRKLLRVLNKTDLLSAEELEKRFPDREELNPDDKGMKSEREELKPERDEINAEHERLISARKEMNVERKGLIYISAKTAGGVENLKQRLVQFVLAGKTQTEGTIVTNVRHYDALMQVRTSLTDIRTGLDSGLPGDLLSLDIRRCLHYLGEITGEITNEEQLSWIFGKFCVGK